MNNVERAKLLRRSQEENLQFHVDPVPKLGGRLASIDPNAVEQFHREFELWMARLMEQIRVVKSSDQTTSSTVVTTSAPGPKGDKGNKGDKGDKGDSADALKQLLSGVDTSLTGTITQFDTILSAFGRLQGELNTFFTQLSNYVAKAGDTMTGDLEIAPAGDYSRFRRVISNDDVGDARCTAELEIGGTYCSIYDVWQAFANGGSREQFNVYLLSGTTGTRDAIMGLHNGSGQHGLTFHPTVTDGAAAVAYRFDCEALANASAKVYSFSNDGIELSFLLQDGLLSALKLRVASPAVPATAADSGTAGDIAWDSDYLYVCVAANTWKRTALSTW